MSKKAPTGAEFAELSEKVHKLEESIAELMTTVEGLQSSKSSPVATKSAKSSAKPAPVAQTDELTECATTYGIELSETAKAKREIELKKALEELCTSNDIQMPSRRTWKSLKDLLVKNNITSGESEEDDKDDDKEDEDAADEADDDEPFGPQDLEPLDEENLQITLIQKDGPLTCWVKEKSHNLYICVSEDGVNEVNWDVQRDPTTNKPICIGTWDGEKDGVQTHTYTPFATKSAKKPAVKSAAKTTAAKTEPAAAKSKTATVAKKAVVRTAKK